MTPNQKMPLLSDLFLSVLFITAALSKPLILEATDGSGRWKGSTVTIPKYSPLRSLRQTDESCQWRESDSKCVLSDVERAALLDLSDSPFAKLHRRVAECRIQGPDQESCVAQDACGWDWGGSRCYFVDYVNEYSSSPCVYSVPKSMEFNALVTKCPSLNFTQCTAMTGCRWRAEYEVCRADILAVYLDIDGDSFRNQSVEVEIAKSNEAYDLFRAEYESDWLGLLWGMSHEWEPPQTECPEGYDQLVCDYLDAYLSRIWPTLFYCSSMYDPFDILLCIDDGLCDYSISQDICIQNYSITRKALNEADKVFLDLISEPADRKMFKSRMRCPRITNKNECTGACGWHEESQSCSSSEIFRARQYSAQAKLDPDDPVCRQFGIPLMHDCYLQTTKQTCHAQHKNCNWKPQTKSKNLSTFT